MGTATLVAVDEYLSTACRPDRDYLDGLLAERNMGAKDHGKLQRNLLVWFHSRSHALGLAAFPEQRIRVATRRYRVPDVCVVKLPEPDEQIFTQPPFICIEILSPDDSFPQLQSRFDDYLATGVPNIWVIHSGKRPATRRAWTVKPEGHLETLDGALRTIDGRVTLPVSDLFA